MIPKQPFERGKPTPRGDRKPTKHKNPQRDWADPWDKVRDEGRCRRCHSRWMLDPAHIVPRSRLKPGPAENPLNIIVLCRKCHNAYDELGLDLSPFLTTEEWEFAVGLVGESEARRRVTNKRAA